MQEKIRYTFDQHALLPLYLDSIGYNPQELDFERPEGYPYYHWLQTIEGEGVIELKDQHVVLKEGQGLLLTPYTAHNYHPNYTVTDNWSTVYVTFGGHSIDEILDTLNLNFSSLYLENTSGVFYQFMKTVFSVLRAQDQSDPHLHFDASGYLYQFLMHLKKHGTIGEQLSNEQSYSKVRPIVEYLEQHFGDNIGLNEMSDAAGISAQHLNKLFHDTFGMSPYAFLVQMRMREAKRLMLTDMRLTLKDIADQVGFNAVSHFVTTFKSREGMTPKQYRNLHKKD